MFKRMIFRVTRGTTWTKVDNIEYEEDEAGNLIQPMLDPTTGELLKKAVFLIVYQGGGHDILRKKLNRICNAFGASKHKIPPNHATYMKNYEQVDIQLDDANKVAKATKLTIEKMLFAYTKPNFPNGNCSMLEEYKLFVLKEKTIYHHLNKFKLEAAIYHGRCWCPNYKKDVIVQALNNLSSRKPNVASGQLNKIEHTQAIKAPPTHFRTNVFTAPFQEIVDTYGVPRYREINPGLFTVITFPFQFGMMFGDIGHGGMILALALYLMFMKEELQRTRSALRIALPYRYLLLLMGIFATFNGSIYNDFLSIPTNFFGSCWNTVDNPRLKGSHIGERIPGCTYPYGMDPKWYIASNELQYFNSFKMKMSVIVGVL